MATLVVLFVRFVKAVAFALAAIFVVNPPNATVPTIPNQLYYKNDNITASSTYTDANNDTGNITFKWYNSAMDTRR